MKTKIDAYMIYNFFLFSWCIRCSVYMIPLSHTHIRSAGCHNFNFSHVIIYTCTASRKDD